MVIWGMVHGIGFTTLMGAGIASGNQTWLAGTVSISFDDQRKNLHLQGISQLRLITEEIFDGI